MSTGERLVTAGAVAGVGLVGRARELDHLRRLVQEAAGGRGRSVWVEGEPGIGKSALLAAVLDMAKDAGCQVFHAEAYQTGEVFPLRPLLEALRVHMRSTDADRLHIAGLLWGRGQAVAATPHDTLPAAAESLVVLVERTCLRRPMILAVDDAQLADDMSLAVWGRLHRMVHQLPLLLLAAARPVAGRDDLQSLRRSMVGPDAVVIEPASLSETEGIELLERLVGAQPGLTLCQQVTRAGGNPLYLRELTDALIRGRRVVVRDGVAELIDPDETFVPASVAAAVSARLGFLSQRATEVLRLASLLGPDFRVENLAAVAGSTATGLLSVVEEAVTAGVLTESGSRLRFRHPLIRQVLYEAMPAGLRTALHQQAGAALASAGAGVDVVAEQLLAAPQSTDEWVVEWLAGVRSALTSRAPKVAVALLQRVRARDINNRRRAEFDVQLANALFVLGRYDEVEELARSASTTDANEELIGQLTWTFAYALLRMIRYDDAHDVVVRVLGRAELSPIWRARLLAMQAMTLNRPGHFEEAIAVAAQAEAAAQVAGDRIAVGYALHTRAFASHRHRRDQTEVLHILDRALAVLGDSPDAAELQLILLSNRGATLEYLGRIEEADRTLAQGLALAERTATPTRLAIQRVQVADVLYLRGRWDDALAELDAASGVPMHDTLTAWQRGLRTLIAVHADDRTTVGAHLRGLEDLDLDAGEMRYYAEYLRIGQALSAERDGGTARAFALLRMVFDADGTGRYAELGESSHVWLPELVRLALACEDRAAAQAATKVCRAAADLEPHPMNEAAARHCEGLTAADPAWVLGAAELLRSVHHPLHQAQALENAAVLFAQRREVAAAHAAYADAVRIYSDLEASWDLLRARTRVRPYGIRHGVRGPRRRPATGWQALTPTELKIADRVAAGQSNADIADELFLSRRTVQTHVSHILTKLEAHSRVEIARLALLHQSGRSR